MIKKIIHQIWLQGLNNIPDELLERRQTILNIHDSSWTYILWDEIDIINLMRQDVNYLQVYYKLEYMHQKIDFAKYIILYKFGGVYIDIDVEMIGSLDSILKDNQNFDLIVSKIIIDNFIEEKLSCDDQICLNNGIIMAKQGCDVLYNLIQNILKNYECKMFDVKISCINNTTGPKFLTHYLLSYKGNSRVLYLEPEYLEPCVGEICYKNEKTIAMHKHTLSWFNKRFKRFFRFYLKNNRQIYNIIRMIFILLLIYVIFKIYNKFQ